MEKTKLQIMEEATAIVAENLFKLKYPEVSMEDAPKLVQDCINDTVFVINNFLRVSTDLTREELGKYTTAGEH